MFYSINLAIFLTTNNLAHKYDLRELGIGSVTWLIFTLSQRILKKSK